jgi:hypothetical protein
VDRTDDGEEFLNPDNDLCGSDFIPQVSEHLEAYGFWPVEPETVTCKFCHKEVDAKTAHLHQNEWVGDECCWDERLRSTE